MKTELNTYETEVLNKVIPTPAFGDWRRLQESLRDAISEDEAGKLNNGKSGGGLNVKTFQKECIKNIQEFLVSEAFYAEREGGVFFLTDKGKHLWKQKSVQQYHAWKEERGVGLRKDLRTIKERGYLDQDEVVRRGRRKEIFYKVRKFVLYPLLVIIVIMLIAGYLHKNGYDKKFPAFRAWMDKKKF